MADIARLGHVTRARATQIMNLLNLAPDIQEQILFLEPTVKGRDTIKEWQVRPIAASLEWSRQRRMWRSVQPSPEESSLADKGRLLANSQKRSAVGCGASHSPQ
jgi:hypothetical protein